METGKSLPDSMASNSGTEPRPRNRQRVAKIVLLLRCPASGYRLRIESDQSLVTEDGSHRWPLRHGRPIFFGSLEDVREFPATHLSNPIPAPALKLIAEARGPVLNMSAGGTEMWFPNVVEVETAIFRNTDIVGDAHALPFGDGVFDAVLAINAFEHYRQPEKVVSEILRVLKPGGHIFIHTAFLQPLHEPPWHFFNCTKFGLQQWFSPFEILSLQVSENFNPIYALAWQTHEMLAVLRAERGSISGDRIGAMPLKDLAEFWNQPALRKDPTWKDFFQLSQPAQERLAAGFELIARKK